MTHWRHGRAIEVGEYVLYQGCVYLVTRSAPVGDLRNIGYAELTPAPTSRFGRTSETIHYGVPWYNINRRERPPITAYHRPASVPMRPMVQVGEWPELPTGWVRCPDCDGWGGWEDRDCGEVCCGLCRCEGVVVEAMIS